MPECAQCVSCPFKLLEVSTPRFLPLRNIRNLVGDDSDAGKRPFHIVTCGLDDITAGTSHRKTCTLFAAD